MRVNGRTRLADVTAEDVLREARGWGLGSRHALSTLEAVSGRLRTAVAHLPGRDGRDLTGLVKANLNRLAG